MRVLVTGATGFVGRHLTAALEARGHSLTLALRSRDAETRLPQRRPDSERQVVLVGEIDQDTDWRPALKGADAVIHLAARAHVLDTGADDEEAFTKVNALGTERLVRQSVGAGVERFVLMSSIGAVTSESDALITLQTPCEPDTAYGRSKRAAEQALFDGAAGTPMSWTVLRPTLVYGPGNPGNMERLVALVNRGIPLPLGGIRNRRSFTFVGNLVDVTAKALTSSNARDAVFLVSDGEDLSTPELVRRIAKLAGTPTRILPVPRSVLRGIARGADAFAAGTSLSLPVDTPTLRRLESSLYVDIGALRAKLDWTPPFGVDEGLRCMLTPP